jgi:hypothetical protein
VGGILKVARHRVFLVAVVLPDGLHREGRHPPKLLDVVGEAVGELRVLQGLQPVLDPGQGLVAAQPLEFQNAQGDDDIFPDGVVLRHVEFGPEADQRRGAPPLQAADAPHAAGRRLLLLGGFPLGGWLRFCRRFIGAAGHGFPKDLVEDLLVILRVREIDPVEVVGAGVGLVICPPPLAVILYSAIGDLAFSANYLLPLRM